jgi:multidrug resistance efflux pump
MVLSLAFVAACQEVASLESTHTARVERGNLVFTSSFYGELTARESQAIHVPEFSDLWSLTVGTVLEDGSHVKKGDVVLTFLSVEVEEDLREKKTALAVAKAELRRERQKLNKERIDLDLAVKRWEMMVEREKLNVLAGGKLISQLELEKAKLDVARAELELSLARKALKAHADKERAGMEVQRLKVESILEKAKDKEEQIKQMELKAPADGMIYGPYTRLNWVRAKVEPGRVVRPGDKLLEIPNLTAFNAELYVRQRDGMLLKEGSEATVFPTALPSKSIRGKITSKESFATTRNQRLGTDEPAGNLKEIKVVLELDEAPEQLRPGGTVRAEVRTVLAEDVLLVTLTALREEKSGHSVRLKSGERRQVKIGQASTTMAEVLEGLSEGDQVILD